MEDFHDFLTSLDLSSDLTTLDIQHRLQNLFPVGHSTTNPWGIRARGFDTSSQRNEYVYYSQVEGTKGDKPFQLQFTTSTSDKAYLSKTPLKHLTRTRIADLPFDRPAKGKYLLLRTLEKAYVILSIHTFVEDHAGDGILFCCYNLMADLTDDCEEVFPVGTIFILKEPYFKLSRGGRYMLRSDCPTDIMILHEGHKYFSLTDGVVWKNEPSPRPYPDSEYERRKTANEWKVLGNQMFKRQKFIHATRFYSKGLFEAEKDKDTDLCKLLHLNLSAVHISSGWYESAIQAAERALEIDPKSEKGYFRAGRANYELRKFEESKQWFSKLFQIFPGSKEAMAELKRCESRLTEAAQGNYSIYHMVSERISRPRHPVDCADYMGDIRVTDIPGKGRGYVATKDISPGTLVLVSKALGVAWKDISQVGFQINKDNTADEIDSVKLVSVISNIMMKNPVTFGSAVYNLSVGVYEAEDGQSPPPLFCDTELQEEPVVDVDRIRHILITNCHRASSGNIEYQTSFAEGSSSFGDAGRGLFLSACFFNHHCVSNALYEVYNDVMFVRAIQHIKEGEEVSIPYLPVEKPYHERMEMCGRRGFHCDCRLCVIDGNEPASLRMQRQALLTTFHEEIKPKIKLQTLYVNIFREMKELIADIKSTYKKSKRKAFRLDLVWVYIWHGLAFRKCGMHAQEAQCFLNAIHASGFKPDELLLSFQETNSITLNQSTFIFPTVMSCLEVLIHSYMTSGDVTSAKNWLLIMLAFEKIISGGDLKVFKQKYTNLKIACKLL